MKKRLRFTALALSLLLLPGCGKQPELSVEAFAPTALPTAAATATASPTPAPTPTQAPQEPELRWPSRDGIHADVDYADMRWYLYDTTEFDQKAAELAETTDGARAVELYTWLSAEHERVYTLHSLAWIDYYATGVEEAAEHCRQTDELSNTINDSLFNAISLALEGPAGEELARFLGKERSAAYTGYEEMTERQSELMDRETELQLQYNDLMLRDDLSVSELGYAAAEIFLELVKVRNEYAQLLGYDSYAEYAYPEIYERDYSPEDAAALCAAIHPYARVYYEDCCYCGAFFAPLSSDLDLTQEELMAMLRRYASRISPMAAEAEAYMEDHGLYLWGGEDEISQLGYTDILEYYKAPFMYVCLYGGFYSIRSVIHEFGHYYDAYLTLSPDPMLYYGSYDIFEIHSTGMEALSYYWQDELTESAEEGRIYCMDNLIDAVVSGCLYDEFQQYAYAHPDMTVEELGEAYLSICDAYGARTWTENERYGWVFVNHNFDSPFYYISYAASALAALQIWSLAEEDFDAAVALYDRLVHKGAFELGYCELMEEMGLTLFSDDLAACIAEPLARMREMCLRYDGRTDSRWSDLFPAAA